MLPLPKGRVYLHEIYILVMALLLQFFVNPGGTVAQKYKEGKFQAKIGRCIYSKKKQKLFRVTVSF
jgi:hypothetical protein